jgi:hypothetical protein
MRSPGSDRCADAATMSACGCEPTTVAWAFAMTIESSHRATPVAMPSRPRIGAVNPRSASWSFGQARSRKISPRPRVTSWAAVRTPICSGVS